MLRESGVLTDECNEMDSWFRHLDGNLDAFVVQCTMMFLAEVCHFTAADPYTYTDRVLEFVAEARTELANKKSIQPGNWLPENNLSQR